MPVAPLRPQLDPPSDEPAQPQARASLQSFGPQIGTRSSCSSLHSIRTCSTLAERPPRVPRSRKQCLDQGNLCGRFSLSAAPTLTSTEQGAGSIEEKPNGEEAKRKDGAQSETSY